MQLITILVFMQGMLKITPALSQPNPPSVSFEGINHLDIQATTGFFSHPPFPGGEAGPAHYVQTALGTYRVWDKAGNPLTPPRLINSIFDSAGVITGNDAGTSLVLYDQLADRWLLILHRSDFTPVQRLLIAVSKTGDPTGAYHCYSFAMPFSKYYYTPQFGVWPDGYYMGSEIYDQTGAVYFGSAVAAFDRKKMLTGDPSAGFVYFDNATIQPFLSPLLPSDLEGLTLPPLQAPNTFACLTATETGDSADALRLFDFHADFETPSNSSFTERPESPLIVSPFTPAFLPISQPTAAASYLAAHGDRLMYKLAYRNLGSRESLVANHSVNVLPSTGYRAGIRFYELTKISAPAPYAIREDQTFSPDANHRWLGSGTINHQGDLAVGYNVSSVALFPSIRYAARLGTDTPGSGLAQGEQVIVNGTGFQSTTTGRWGEHSYIAVDPTDDCSFWYTSEYYITPSEGGNVSSPWHTRIAKFAPGNCTISPRGIFQGVVTDCETGLPVENAIIEIQGYFRSTDENGAYEGFIAPGSYTAKISAENFSSITQNFMVNDNGTAIINACLDALPVLDSVIVLNDQCNNNGIIDPFEDITIDVRLKNAGMLVSTPVTISLLQTGTINNASSEQTYDTISPGNTLSASFSFNAGDFFCGSLLELSFELKAGSVVADTFHFIFNTGILNPGVNTYSSGDIATPIPDDGFVDINILVEDTFSIGDINAAIRINHTFAADIEIELIHPDNTSVILVNNRGAGGDNFGTGTLDCSGTNTTFDDQSFFLISGASAPFAGDFRPESPLSIFNGKNANGIWKLRVKDQAFLDEGTIGCASLAFQKFTCCEPGVNFESITISSESCTPGNGVVDPGETATFTLCLRNSGTRSGNITGILLSNANVISAGVPMQFGEVEADSLACSNFSFFALGECGEEITASIVLSEEGQNFDTIHYTIVMGFAGSNNFSFSNTTAIVIPAAGSVIGPASIYPSTINVSGISGKILKVTATLTGLSHTFASDIDVLLTGPQGQKTWLMSDLGGFNSINQVNLTFDDDADTIPPTLLVSGTYKPHDITFGEVMPSPAPLGPFIAHLGVFNGTDPNGTWSLYVADDAAQDDGSLTSWSLSFTIVDYICCDDSCTPSIVSPREPLTFCENDTLIAEPFCVSYEFAGSLSAIEEVPPNISSATGNFNGTFNLLTNELTIHVSYNNLSGPGLAAHIHEAPLGVVGPVIVPFETFVFGDSSGSFSKTVILTPAQEAAFLAGGTYINVHSIIYPGGEIRGQIFPQEQCDELSYEWSTGDTTASIHVIESGHYIVTATDAEGCTSVATVQAIEQTFVTVNAGMNQEVCEENMVSLNGSFGGGATSATWTTSGSGTFIPNDTDPDASYQPSPADALNGSVEIHYTVNDDIVCGIISDTMLVTLTQLSPPAEIMTGNELICNPQPGSTYIYSVQPIAGVAEYNWTTSNPNIIILDGQGTASVTVTFNPSALHLGINGELCVTTSNGGSCNNSIPLCKKISVQISAPVTPGSISGPAKACPDDTATYSISFVSRAAYYDWTAPAGATVISGQGELVAQVAYSPSFAGGNVTVAAVNGCGQSPPRIRMVGVNVLNAPGTIQGPPAGLCELQDVIYSVNSVPGAHYYQWTIPAGATVDGPSDQSSIVLDFANNFATGTLVCRAVNNCGPGISRSLTLKGAPAAPGSISGIKTVCAQQSYPYSVATVQGATGYIWTAPGTITNQGSKDILVKFGGPASSQIITVKASNNCGLSPVKILNGITIQICVREEENAISGLTADPNPATDLLNVKFNSERVGDYIMTFTDVAGRIIYKDQVPAIAGSNQVIVNMAGFAQGIYLLNLQSEHWSEQLKIVIEQK